MRDINRYIQNLAKNLIGKHRYKQLATSIQEQPNEEYDFIGRIKLDLELDDVKVMHPETLGKIMCSFKVGEVLATQEEIFKHIHFSGDCEEMLREMVATCLAFAILQQLGFLP